MWAYFSASLVLLPVVRVAIAFVGVQRTAGWVKALSRFSVGPFGDQILVSTQLHRVVDVAGRRGPIKATCVPQSLVLWWLLAVRGVEASVRIGSIGDAASFTAHAWVEVDGSAFGRGEHEPFGAFDLMSRTHTPGQALKVDVDG